MVILPKPANHKDLSETIALVALDPERYNVLPQGELVLEEGSSDQRITTIFKRLIETFRALKEVSSNTEATRRCLKGLHLLARCEVTGEAKDLLKEFPLRIKKTADIHLPPAESLGREECQQILSALHYERQFARTGLGFFGIMRRILELDVKTQELGGVPTEAEGGSLADIISYENASSHLLAALMRNSSRVMGEQIDARIIAEDQIVPLIDETERLKEEGLLTKEDEKSVKLLRLSLEKQRLTEISDNSDYSKALFALSKLSFRPNWADLEKEASLASRVIKCFAQIASHNIGTTNQKYESWEVKDMLDCIFPFIKEVSAADARYNDIYARLRKLTRKVSLVRFRKLLFDPETLLPKRENSPSSWRLIQESASPPETNKNTGRSRKHKKSRKSEKKSPKASSQKKCASKQPARTPEKAIASPSPAPAAASPLPVPQGLNYQYAERVLQFLNPGRPGRTRDEIEHGFGRAVDGYVERLGIATTWKGKDTLFSIPGEMEYQGRVHRGVFTYCFDGKNSKRCYHRCFMRKPADEMIAEFSAKGFWEFDFPALSTEHAESYLAFERAEDGSRIMKEYRNVVEIKDPRNSATIRLFKVKNEQLCSKE